MITPKTEFHRTSDTDDELLGVAALFEGPFSIDWIQEITLKKATQVLSIFEKGVQAGVLNRDAIGAYIFATPEHRRKWHKMVSPAERAHLLRQIATLLYRNLPDSAQKAETMAPYLLHLPNDLSGCRCLMAAAGRYQTAFHAEQALQCYSKLLDDLSAISGKEADQLFCDAALQYSKLTTARHETQRVLSILEEAMIRAKQQGNYRYQSLLDMHFAKNKWLQSKYRSAVKHFEQAWALAKQLDDAHLLRSTATFKTFFLFWQGRFQEAVADYEKALPEVEKFPHGRFPLLASMTIGTCYGKIGQVTQGIGMLDAIRRQCLARGDIGLAAHSGICIGAIMLDNGWVEEACRHLIPCVAEAKTAHPDWTLIQGELVLAHAYFLQGRYDACVQQLGRYTEHARQVQVSVRTWSYLMELCWAVAEGVLPAIPELSLQDEINRMLKGQNIFLKGVAYRFTSLLQQKQGVTPAAIVKNLNRSIELLKLSGHAIELAKAQLALARVYLLQNHRPMAIQTAEPAMKSLNAANQRLIPDDLKPILRADTPIHTLFNDIVRFSNELCALQHGKDALQHILSTANRMIGAERGAIFIWEGARTGHGFRPRASKNLTEAQIESAGFASSIQLMTRVVSKSMGIVQGTAAPGGNEGSEAGIRSRICVPILGKGQTLGVLYHDNCLMGNAFEEAQLAPLSFFAAQTALALENDRIHRENRSLNKRCRDLTAHYDQQHRPNRKIVLDAFIGESAAIQKVMARINEVAPTHATVLILGETGVGKGVVANAIQRHSLRKEQPFISLNCNALSETLIYSELFGHEKGAFTGADRQHIGRFEKVNGGTLFLDEIGDLPPQVQVRLLRVLETKEFERVGGTATIRSDFRLITATNTDLSRAMKEKRFREDLYYRINVFSIHVPPLRDRKEDIPLLVHHFLKVQANETGKRGRPIADAEMAALMQYPWPGNVRELKNITERYAISGAGSHTSIVDLLDANEQAAAGKPPAVTLRENERRHILWALERTGGKIHGPGGAAELLDIHPNTLSFRMKRLDIQRKKAGIQNIQ
jgi:transcriptional regulator with GAF, ATPase, and Fis domain